MKRPIAAGLVALAVAIVVWRTAARSATSAPASRDSAATAATAGRKADPRQAPRATIAGHVTAAGKPVAGAHVCADPLGIGDLGRDATCTDSDATGAYALGELLTAQYRISANARGMRPATEHTHLDAGVHATVDLALATGGVELSGTVTDIAGGPIAHAQVRADEALVESDDQGRFSLWVDPTDISVEATADGYAPAQWNGHPPDRAELRMQPESALAGTVVSIDGAPVAGARVDIDGVDWHLPSVQTTSGDDGSFHADRLAPGRYTVTVRSPSGYGASDGSILVAMAEHTDGVVVTLAPAFHVAGRILTAEGKPCTEGWVRLVDEEHARTISGDSDETGALEVDGLLPGTYTIHVTCTGYLEHVGDTIDIRDKDVAGLTWKLEPGATLRGHVTLRDGSPVAGAEVRVQGASWGNATTTADGAYTIAGLPAGSYTIMVTGPHATSQTSESLEIAERATVDHDLVMDAGAAIRGVVVDARGAPVAGANVRLRDVYLAARTSADGSFLIEPVTAGEHELAVEISDHYVPRPGSDGEEVLATITVAPGETATTRLVIDIQTSAITGVVVDGNGAPMRDVVVELLDSTDTPTPPLLTGDDGAFRFAAVVGARYRLHASAAGRGERFVDVEPGEPLKVQLEAGSITGIVRGSAEELSITVGGASYRTESFFHTGGRFALHDLRPGHYSVTIDSESGHSELEVDVADGPSEPLDLTLEPVFTFTGRVVREDTHAPLAGVHVQYRVGAQRLPDDSDGAITDAAGRFTVRRGRRGSAEVRLWIPDSMQRWIQAEVTGPDVGDVVLPTPQVIDVDSE